MSTCLNRATIAAHHLPAIHAIASASLASTTLPPRFLLVQMRNAEKAVVLSFPEAFAVARAFLAETAA